MSLWFLLVCHALTQNDAESPVDIFLSTSQKRSQKHMSSQKVFTFKTWFICLNKFECWKTLKHFKHQNMIHDVSSDLLATPVLNAFSDVALAIIIERQKQTILLRSMSNKVPSSEVTKWILRSSHDSFVHFCDDSAGKTEAKHMENGLIFHVTIQIQILTMFSVQSKYSKKTKSISLLGFVISNKTCKTRNVQIRCQPSRLSSPLRWKPNSLLPMQKSPNGFISPQMSHNFQRENSVDGHVYALIINPWNLICNMQLNVLIDLAEAMKALGEKTKGCRERIQKCRCRETSKNSTSALRARTELRMKGFAVADAAAALNAFNVQGLFVQLGMTAMVLSFLDDAEVRPHCWKRSSLCERMHCFCESWMSTQVTCVLFLFCACNRLASTWEEWQPQLWTMSNEYQSLTNVFSTLESLNHCLECSELQYLRELLWYAPDIYQCCLGWAGRVWVRCRLQFWRG